MAQEEPEYPCESCGRYIPESEIPFDADGAIMCWDCINDPHIGRARVCANCGYELESGEKQCDRCGYINGNY